MPISNAQRQRVRGLQQAKQRRKYNAFTVEGLVNIGELLGSDLQLSELYLTTAAHLTLQANTNQRIRSRLRDFTRDSPAQFHEVGQAELERLSSQKNPHGGLAVVEMPTYTCDDLQSTDRILYLDGVSDPGNVGTLIRTAEWFGFGGVIAGPESTDFYNPKVVAAARGSLFRMPHMRASPDVLAKAYRDWPLIVANLGGVNARNFEWPDRGLLIIGSESHGPSGGILRLSPKQVTIPSRGYAPTESLNAAVAGSILMSMW